MLTRKTFLTKDDDGCEFKVTAFYGDSRNGRYQAMGIKSENLKELKSKISLIGKIFLDGHKNRV